MTKHNVDKNVSEDSILQDFILATSMIILVPIIFLGICSSPLPIEFK